MKEYIVTFEIEGEIHSLKFTDNINSDNIRKINAKMWINDYVQNNLGIKEGKMFNIISIDPIKDNNIE
jgi:hypothetical protein